MSEMKQAWVRWFLWTAVFVLPIPVGAYLAQPPDSILISAGIFLLLSMLVPCVRLAHGGEAEKIMAAAHPVCAVCVNFLFDATAGQFLFMTMISADWNLFVQEVCWLVFFTVSLALILLADIACLFTYRRIREKFPKQREWLVFAFYTGTIPGIVLVSYFVYAIFSEDSAYFLLFSFIPVAGMLWVKTFLATVVVVLYFFVGSKGSGKKRLTRAAFIGFFWLSIVHILPALMPLTENHNPWTLETPMDFASIILLIVLVFPFVSDLCLAFVSVRLGTLVTKWIWRE